MSGTTTSPASRSEFQATPVLPQRFNFRDLGGAPTLDGRTVRKGRLFRGGSLNRIEAQEAIVASGLSFATAIDLRATAEFARGRYSGTQTETHHLPIFDQAPAFGGPIEDIAAKLAETYVWMLEVGQSSIAGGLELLCDPRNLPSIVYCAAGKDRTGVFCAIVLDLVGVGRDRIIEDYTLSDAPAQALRAWQAALPDSVPDPVPAGIYRAPDRAMRLFYDAVALRYGSLRGYLAQIDVPVGETAQALANNLLVE
jgi:protein-tyrosine phosphatase